MTELAKSKTLLKLKSLLNGEQLNSVLPLSEAYAISFHGMEVGGIIQEELTIIAQVHSDRPWSAIIMCHDVHIGEREIQDVFGPEAKGILAQYVSMAQAEWVKLWEEEARY